MLSLFHFLGAELDRFESNFAGDTLLREKAMHEAVAAVKQGYVQSCIFSD